MKRAGLFWLFVVTSLFTVSSHAGEFDDLNQSKSSFQPVKSIVGVTLGTPALIHLSCATFTESKFGARLVIGGFPGRSGPVYGFQAGVVKKVGERKKTIHELAFGLGYSMINTDATSSSSKNNKQLRYLHFSYDLTLDRFMLEVGLSGGSGSYPNPQLLVQIGIAYSKTRFR
jgi:hypothetical protein